MRKKFEFSLLNSDLNARAGQIITAHGIIETPIFMPVGTLGTVKAMHLRDVLELGAQVILANTYHLMLRPGEDVIKKFGGVRKFMSWEKPLLTDSGGFQIMSLSSLTKISNSGVEFKSHVDGTKYFLTPEKSTEIQKSLDATISMQLDECIPYPVEKQKAYESMELSLNWAKRSRDAFSDREGYGQFGIVQGSVFSELREISALQLKKIDFEGFAIGGLAVGEPQQTMFKTIENTIKHLPVSKPRYLMGVGKPDDIIGAIKRGVDMFDCVLPTRSGRTGLAFTWNGRINIRNSKYQNDNSPLDPNCAKFDLNKYSKNYLNHLFNTNEILGSMLLTLHNINFYQELMETIRKNIEKGTFQQFHDSYINKL